MTPDQLKEVVRLHALWADGHPDGKRAYLRGAYLRGAYLRGTYLRDAYLEGADLRGADLTGADLIDAGQRSDGFQFCAHISDNNLMILAGCRYLPLCEARKHWRNTRGGTPLGDETILILDYIEQLARLRGWSWDETTPEAAA